MDPVIIGILVLAVIVLFILYMFDVTPWYSLLISIIALVVYVIGDFAWAYYKDNHQ